MIRIPFACMVLFISVVWCLVRAVCAIKNRGVNLRREAQLLLVYACIIVIVRFTFFHFSSAGGWIQPLVFDLERAFPPRINPIPFINLFDYPTTGAMAVNIIGNVAMFMPLGIVLPIVYKELNTHARVLLSGVACSLAIEILQLPFYTRVTDVDDLLLNSLGCAFGYAIFLLINHFKKKRIR